MIRIAAVGDLHCHGDCAGRYLRWYADLREVADLFLIAGDFTALGTPKEAGDVAAELRPLGLPVLGVLGNHDWHAGRVPELVRVLEDAGVEVLDGGSRVLEVRGQTVGVVGAKGFAGGFAPAQLTAFGEPLIKAWAAEAAAEADKVAQSLRGLRTDYRIVLLHYSPIPETVQGERHEIHPFLGSSHLADAIDRQGADLVLHGHAHMGREKGQTPSGIPVRNVALPVLRRQYALFELRPEPDGSGPGAAS